MSIDTDNGRIKRCELCSAKVNGAHKLTADSHPEGPNHLVGECCVEAEAESKAGE